MKAAEAQAQRRNYHYMADAMRRLEWDLHQTIVGELRIPDDWHRIAQEKPAGKSTRVTLRMDADVVAFFRSMGPDWQRRLNRVAAAWMHARLAGLIEGAETMDYFRRPKDPDQAALVTGDKPRFGDEHRRAEAAGMPEDYAWGDPLEGTPGVPMGAGRHNGMTDAEAREWLRLKRARMDKA